MQHLLLLPNLRLKWSPVHIRFGVSTLPIDTKIEIRRCSAISTTCLTPTKNSLVIIMDDCDKKYALANTANIINNFINNFEKGTRLKASSPTIFTGNKYQNTLRRGSSKT
jgi:hypothetical protein